MAADSHPHGRVGARHRAKLEKWSGKVVRAEAARGDAISDKRPAASRKRPLDAARTKLRKLFR
jgi:hypothetical protein